jgi:arylformamidase
MYDTPMPGFRRQPAAGTPLSRRTLLALSLGIVADAEQAVGPPPATKGPKVFLEYDQVELDAMYNQAAYASNAAQIQRRYSINSDFARARLGAPERRAYGSADIEKVDIFSSKRPNAPVCIFIHGGAWRVGSAKDWGFLAEPYVNTGTHFVIPDFAPVTELGGSLLAMEQQVRRAIQWVQDKADTFGGNPERVYLSGHSSGAHLAAAAITRLPEGVVRGALLVSGMYDLRGPRLSARSSYVKFDDRIEDELSPQRHIDKIRVPVVIAYSNLDTPEFQRQSRDFIASLRAAGKPVREIVGDAYNHFEFIETLANPYGVLGHAALEMMRYN